MRKKVKADIQAYAMRLGKHLFPVHCPQQPEHPDGHWTLLSLEKAFDESPLKVRYFETLDTPNGVCLMRATRYHGMSEIERSMLCKLMVFEAAKRHAWSANTHTNRLNNNINNSNNSNNSDNINNSKK